LAGFITLNNHAATEEKVNKMFMIIADLDSPLNIERVE